MKLSSLGLSLAVASSSIVGIAVLAPSAKAASIYADNYPVFPLNNGIEFSGLWEFTFVGSYGSYKSNFGIAENVGSTLGVKQTTLFQELDRSVPGNVGDPNPSTYTFDFGKTFPNFEVGAFFLQTVEPVGTPTIYSGLNKGFYIATTTDTVLGLTSVDAAPYNVAFQQAINTYVPQGYRVIGVNDTFKGDKDYNDFIVIAKPVPVPAIVPGIALASAFFGSKALKRKQKKVSDSVA